jgi:hypothetical protein
MKHLSKYLVSWSKFENSYDKNAIQYNFVSFARHMKLYITHHPTAFASLTATTA